MPRNIISLFETSDTHSKAYAYEGDPQYIVFEIPWSEDQPAIKWEIPLPEFLEMFRLFNAVWYGGLWVLLNICVASFCANIPKGCHYRQETCPTLTEFEKNMLLEYNSRLSRVQMGKNRAPIPDSATSDNAQSDGESSSSNPV